MKMNALQLLIEEEIFYPAVRGALKDKDLLEVIRRAPREGRRRREMFPKIRRARMNLEGLGKKLMVRKIKLAP